MVFQFAVGNRIVRSHRDLADYMPALAVHVVTTCGVPYTGIFADMLKAIIKRDDMFEKGLTPSARKMRLRRLFLGPVQVGDAVVEITSRPKTCMYDKTLTISTRRGVLPSEPSAAERDYLDYLARKAAGLAPAPKQTPAAPQPLPPANTAVAPEAPDARVSASVSALIEDLRRRVEALEQRAAAGLAPAPAPAPASAPVAETPPPAAPDPYEVPPFDAACGLPSGVPGGWRGPYDLPVERRRYMPHLGAPKPDDDDCLNWFEPPCPPELAAWHEPFFENLAALEARFDVLRDAVGLTPSGRHRLHERGLGALNERVRRMFDDAVAVDRDVVRVTFAVPDGRYPVPTWDVVGRRLGNLERLLDALEPAVERRVAAAMEA